MEPLILASASPRRATLLRQIGIDFEQIASRIEDERSDFTDPGDHVVWLSRRKAEEVSGRISNRWVLGVDTEVALKGRIMGKPENEDQAFLMLKALSGRDHSVYTGLTFMDLRSGCRVSQYEKTRVWMRSLTDEDIQDYVATGESLGKAGGYAIQGLGATLVKRIEGCYSNVVGLPLVRLLEMMHQARFPFRLKPLSANQDIS